MEKNWALSVDQCWLQMVWILVHLIDLLGILLRCNGFPGIEKAIVDQTSSRPPMTVNFFWCKFGFGKCFEAASRSKHWGGLLYKIHFGNFSCSCKRISFNDCSQLVIVNFWWLATTPLIFKAVVSLQNLLNHCCTVHLLSAPGPNALLLWVVSAVLWPIWIRKLLKFAFLS